MNYNNGPCQNLVHYQNHYQNQIHYQKLIHYQVSTRTLLRSGMHQFWLRMTEFK